jgi:hypothetical protein
MFGIRHSEEAKRKIGASKHIPVHLYDKNKLFICTFISSNPPVAAKYLNVSKYVIYRAIIKSSLIDKKYYLFRYLIAE